ncbi:SDR family oxidoreductase [Planctomycetota bacterium]
MGDTLDRVVDSIAATTRYPKHLLGVDADLEKDLGIDSVKRVEIVIALGQKFGLDLQSETYDPVIRTISDIARWVDGHLKGDHGARPTTSTTTESSGIGEAVKRGPAVAHVPHSQVVPPTHFHGSRDVDDKASTRERVVFVTGSGRGVGQTIARTLAARGDTVVVNSFHSREAGEQTVSAINSGGGKAIHLWGSLANPEHVDEMFTQIEERYGYLDVLICNASNGRIGNFLDLEFEDWDRAFRTNISGHHRCAVRAAHLMQRVGGGSIVTMSAVGAHHHVDGLGSQGVVKAAVESLTRYLAGELASYGVRVNCVVGGPVYGELISKFPNAEATQNYWESISPDRELSSPVDLINTIEFLIGEKARGINGAIWAVDHGFSSQLADRSLSRVPAVLQTP